MSRDDTSRTNNNRNRGSSSTNSKPKPKSKKKKKFLTKSVCCGACSLLQRWPFSVRLAVICSLC